MTADRCQIQAIHPDLLEQSRQGMPQRQSLRDMADLFKILADDTRMQLICALLHHELCVCDLAELLEMSQSAISHQLRVLRQGRLVRYRRDGKNTFYTLDDQHIEDIVQFALQHVQETYRQE